MAKKTISKISEPQLGIASTYEYFFEVLKPNLDEYRKSSSIRTILNAAWALWHISDWCYWERKPRPKGNDDDCRAFGIKMTNDCKQLLWVRDIAEAGKHFSLIRSTVEVKKISKGSRGHFNIGVFPSIRRSVLQVEIGDRRYDIDVLFERTFLFWLEKIMACPVNLPLPADEWGNSLSEGMIAWCRETLGDEQAKRWKWAYWGGADPPDLARFSFHQQQDADAFRAHWEPLARSSPPASPPGG